MNNETGSRKFRHPGRRSFIFLGFSLVGGFGSWMVTAGSWSVALEIQSLGGLLGIIASLGLAWTGESFINNKK